MAVLKKENQKATWLKGGPPRWSWNLWNTTILCTLFQNCFPLVPLGLQRKFITLWSKFKPVPSLKHLKSWSGSADLSPASNCTCHWLSCKQAGKRCVWRRWGWGCGVGGVAPSSAFRYLPTYHLHGIHHLLRGNGVRWEHKRESWSRWSLGDEWKTLVWPDQGRKTHVLLVLVVWLPVERVGNSSSGRDGEMEGWKRWKRRRRWPLHVCGALTLSWKGLLAYGSFVRERWYLVGKGRII